MEGKWRPRKRNDKRRILKRRRTQIEGAGTLLRWLSATTSGPSAEHSVGWSGVRSHPTALRHIRDCPLREVLARSLNVRSAIGGSEEICRGAAFALARPSSREPGDDVCRSVVPHSLRLPRSTRCRRPAQLECVTRFVREAEKHIFENSLPAGRGFGRTFAAWRRHP